MTDASIGASDLWLGTRTGAGDTATLTESFFGSSQWLNGQQIFDFNKEFAMSDIQLFS